MIKLSRRRHVGIDLARRIHQRRVSAQSRGHQHRRQKRVLIFTIAVLVRHDIRRGVWLVTPLPQRQTDVTKVLGNVFVERFDFLFIVVPPAHQLSDFGANLVVGNDAIALETRVPLTDFIPALEGRHLHLGRLRILQLLPALSPRLFVVVFFFLAFQDRVFPVVDASPVLLFDRWIKTLLGFQLCRTFARNVYLELFVEHNHVLSNEVVIQPEMIRRQRRMQFPNDVILESVSWTQAGHGYMLLPQIGVHRCFARDGRRQVLYIAR